jgi:hypothetical protein
MTIDPKEIKSIEDSMVNEPDEERVTSGPSRALMFTIAVVIILVGAVAMLIGFRLYLK